MKGHEMFFCLDAGGELWILGDHGDIEAADDTALSMGLHPIWVFGEQTANQWRATLASSEAAL